MAIIPYVGGLSIQLIGFRFGKSCTELVKHMALNGGYPLRGMFVNSIDWWRFGKSCTELVKHMALNGGYPLRGMFVNSIDWF